MKKFNYSVVLPYYDKFDLFLKAFESIPDREDIQIIVVDNAPTSLASYQIPSKHNASVVYTKSSSIKGAGCARNVGLGFVEGQFVLFLDADDYFTEDSFGAFDKYLDKDYDIVFFKPTSINLNDGTQSDRHFGFADKVDYWLKTNDDQPMRYRWTAPWSKLFRTTFIIEGGYKFDELRVSNDVWFSLMTGHNAKHVFADSAVVYVVTAGEIGSSLTQKKTKDNWFIRYQVMVRVNKYLKSIGKYKYRIRLLGALRVAWRDFGFKEFLHFLLYAFDNRVGIF